MMPFDVVDDTEGFTDGQSFCLTAFWFAGATLVGLLAATKLIAPDFLGPTSWLQFGRIRPIHVNLVLFGFVTPGLLSSAFYVVPRLLRTELYSEKLGVLTVLLWNLVVAGVVTLVMGHTQARERRTDLVSGCASGHRPSPRFLQSGHDHQATP